MKTGHLAGAGEERRAVEGLLAGRASAHRAVAVHVIAAAEALAHAPAQRRGLELRAGQRAVDAVRLAANRRDHVRSQGLLVLDGQELLEAAEAEKQVAVQY